MKTKTLWKPKFWECEKGGYCEYDLKNDPVADYCVKCKEPYERK